MAQMMMMIAATLAAWALLSVPVGILAGRMSGTSHVREYLRHPLSGAGQARVLDELAPADLVMG